MNIILKAEEVREYCLNHSCVDCKLGLLCSIASTPIAVVANSIADLHIYNSEDERLIKSAHDILKGGE